MSTFLEVENASKAFGGIRAVDEMNLSVDEGNICGVIGPNGSGKTTLLGLLSGTYRPDHGAIRLNERRLDGLSAHRTVQAGVARTFQTSRLFFRWSLSANLAAAAAARPLVDNDIAIDLQELLALVGLAGRASAVCSSLSNGEQRLAMIALALATEPRLILLDEPAVGMSPNETAALANVIRRIRDDRGVTIIIVEHNMHFMMGLADKIMAMNAGRKLAEGTPAEIRGNADVIAAYLGT
jgi:branched-chain amino acid transport system ATP-binding protein